MSEWSVYGGQILAFKPNGIVSYLFLFFLLYHLKSGVNIFFVIYCSWLLPLNWLTLRSIIRICIDLVDNIIHGYGHLSKVRSMLGMEIIPHVLPSPSGIMLLTLSLKSIIFPSAVNQPYHLLPFKKGSVILFIPRKG